MLGFTGVASEADQVMLSENIYQNCLEANFSFIVIYKNY